MNLWKVAMDLIVAEDKDCFQGLTNGVQLRGLVIFYVLAGFTVPIWLLYTTQHNSLQAMDSLKILWSLLVCLVSNVWPLIFYGLIKYTRAGVSVLFQSVESTSDIDRLEALRLNYVDLIRSLNNLFNTLGLILLLPLISGSLHIIIELYFVLKSLQYTSGDVASVVNVLRDVGLMSLLIFPGEEFSDLVREIFQSKRLS